MSRTKNRKPKKNITVRIVFLVRTAGKTAARFAAGNGAAPLITPIKTNNRTHAVIQECAVGGVEDPEWGERVCAAVVIKTDSRLNLADLRQWAREKIAAYKIPGRLLVLEELPRNAMGKVTKPELKKMFAIGAELEDRR